MQCTIYNIQIVPGRLRFYNRKPFTFTNLLDSSIGRDFGGSKGASGVPALLSVVPALLSAVFKLLVLLYYTRQYQLFILNLTHRGGRIVSYQVQGKTSTIRDGKYYTWRTAVHGDTLTAVCPCWAVQSDSRERHS